MDSATVPLKQYEDLQKLYDNLKRNHEDTRKDYGECLIQLRKAQKKIKESHKAIKAWQDYIDSHPKYTTPRNKSDTLPSKVTRDQSVVSHPPLPLPTFQGVLDQADRSEAGLRDDGSISPSLRPPAPTPLANVVEAPAPTSSRASTGYDPEQKSSTAHASSSQTTEGDFGAGEFGETRVKAEPQSDDDEPVVISARQVRKPREERISSTRHPRTTGDYANPHKIKREDDQSSDSMTYIPAVMPEFSHTQASDLDVVSRSIRTPRKRQKLSHLPDARTSSTGPVASVDRSRSIATDVQDENVAPHIEANTTSTDTGRVHQKRPKHTDDDPNSQTSIRSSRSSAGPLTPLSTNTPTLPRTKASNHKARDDQQDEDTDSHSRYHAKSKAQPKRTREVAGLEKEITPPNTNAITTPGHKTYRWRDFGQRTSPAQPTPQTTIKIESRLMDQDPTPARSSARPSRYSPRHADSPPDPRPEEEPLRSRPLSRLSLDDFRINPSYVGTSYAFNTSIRDRDTRACLPGCTGPCCATLLRFADQDRGRSGSREDNTSNSDDETLLRSYLGHSDTAYLNAEQRASLLSAARAEKFAKQHGRHRQIFERRRTPPGFWRTDMPSTQEMEEDRAQARRDERGEVEGRWREALKVGGNSRWRFRDEV